MEDNTNPGLISRLGNCLIARFNMGVVDEKHRGAFRLYNGFYEGEGNLVVDIYARTLLIHDYLPPGFAAAHLMSQVQTFYLEQLPWLDTVVVKNRRSQSQRERVGTIRYGSVASDRVQEAGVWFALNLIMHQEASFFLDTRNLRAWLKDSLPVETLLNTFAYTGSLGVAARAGEVQRVTYLDLQRKYLNIAKTSYTLNGFEIDKSAFIVGDFWQQVGRLKRKGTEFGCVILDPPFFSKTKSGTVNLLSSSHKLINKVRPIVASGGFLVVINNALFMSGKKFIEIIDTLSVKNYLMIEQIIPVPLDVTGYPETIVNSPPVDPTPFNHPTKIAVLRIRHKV
jgi:23S rRNA (cytosine1962-C5)-methyltransferase